MLHVEISQLIHTVYNSDNMHMYGKHIASSPDLHQHSSPRPPAFVASKQQKAGVSLGARLVSTRIHDSLYVHGHTHTHFPLPVKLIAARCRDAVIVSPKSAPFDGKKLMTPSGIPASRYILNAVQFERTAVLAGFHSVTFPIRAGVEERFVPMAVKLNGEMEAMNPSSPRYSKRFQTPEELCRG